jgi:serine/threonine protein kinase
MPYYANSDLEAFLFVNKLPFEEQVRMFIDILVGLQQLHSRFIIHRDIKLKNIFVTADLTCVIGDLGIATTSVDSATS